MKNARSMLGLAATLAFCTTGCGTDADSESAATTATATAIVNGTVMTEAQVSQYGLVALYHHEGANWFIRPCSATIIKSVAGVSWVLTARHCVNTNPPFIQGSQAATSSLRLVAAASPGLANPNPPAGITPDALFLMPAPAEDPRYDLALVRANVNWESRVSSRVGFWVGLPSTLIGTQVTAMGYGVRSTNDFNCSVTPFPSPGAGTASFGQFFSIASVQVDSPPTSYRVNNFSTGGQRISCGDSGGPDFANIGTPDFVWRHLVGVHSDSGASSPMTGDWLQQQLGGLYLSPEKSKNMDLGQSGSSTLLVSATDPRAALLRYNPTTQLIRVGSSSMCLARNSSNLVQFLTCAASNNSHKWVIHPERQIRNGENGQCLTLSQTNEASLQGCSNTTLDTSLRQHWAFHAQP